MGALMQLGYRPYHMVAAYPNAHEEFPSWTEALQLRFGLKKGTSWGRAEFDKLTGDYYVFLPSPVLWRAGMWAAQKVLGYGAFCGLVGAAGGGGFFFWERKW